MKLSKVGYFDTKLFWYLLLILASSIVLSGAGTSGIALTVAITLLINAMMYRSNLLTLFFAFVFLDSYSLVWGGDWGFFSLPVVTIDQNLTEASNILGYFLVIFVFVKGRKLPRFSNIDYWITAFFLLGLLSPLIAIDPVEPTKMALRFVQFYILYILVRILIRTTRDLRVYFQFLLTSFILLFLAIVIQYRAGFFGEGYGEGRPGILSSFIPYLLALTVLPGSNKWLAWPATLFSVFLASFHGSRRIFIAILGYFGLHFKLGVGTLVLIFVLLFTGSFLYSLIPDTSRSRIDNTISIITDISEEGASYDKLNILGSGRWNLWLTTYDMWKDYPIWGIGLKNQVKFMVNYGGSHRARTHNFYLEVLADLGIIGLTVLLILLYNVFKFLNQGLRKFQQSDVFLTTMIQAYKYELTMIHIIAFFGSSMLYSKNAWLLYALVGSLSGMKLHRESNRNINSTKALPKKVSTIGM